MDLGIAQRLTSPEGRALLTSLPAYREADAITLGAALRRAGYDPSLVAAALSQSRLRARARAKLGEFADGMLFTPDGLEQATRLDVAARHAQRFRRAGVRHVLDLGCGLGADAMALASLDLGVTAIEADPATAALAQFNLRHFPDVRVMVALAQDVPLLSLPPAGSTLGAWLDPARRHLEGRSAAGRPRRIADPQRMSPPWSFVTLVAAQIPATGAKMSPSFPVGLIPPRCQAEWISVNGEVVECAIWWGPLVGTPGRTATVIRGGVPGERETTVTEADCPGLGPVATALPAAGSYLYEPDRAVVSAGLGGALVALVDGAELATGVGYVAAERAIDVGYADRYRILESMPLRIKSVRAWLRERSVGRLTIKKRGVRLDADELRAALRLDGRGAGLTAVVTRVGSQAAFLVVDADGETAGTAPRRRDTN